ncbi:MAG: molybdenum cofactor guanylyltransferase [Deltaproteobacteria bacterium]|nr:molybdenum cofactor guanylyltransferase [Deltaproteobacteria bacterium]
MTGIVLIGGKSKRFGKDKIITPIDDKPMIRKVIDVIQDMFDEVILVGHPRDDLNTFKIVEDIIPGCGPLGGIYTALEVAKNKYIFVFGADMPLLDTEFIKHMVSLADKHDIILPIWREGMEPLHAIYNKALIPTIASLIDRKFFKIAQLIGLEDVSVLKVTEDQIRTFGEPERIFLNINTITDLKTISR